MEGDGGFSVNLLTAVFIANDSSNRLLYTTLDLNNFYQSGTGTWSTAKQVGEETAHQVCAANGVAEALSVAVPSVIAYYLSDDNTDRLLEFAFVPST